MTPTPEMIEAAAQAIRDTFCPHDWAVDLPEVYRKAAAAALSAAPSPTPGLFLREISEEEAKKASLVLYLDHDGAEVTFGLAWWRGEDALWFGHDGLPFMPWPSARFYALPSPKGEAE